MKNKHLSALLLALPVLLAAPAPCAALGDDSLRFKNSFDTVITRYKDVLVPIRNRGTIAGSPVIQYNLWPHEKVFGQVHILDGRRVVDITTGTVAAFDGLAQAMALEIVYEQKGCFAGYAETLFPILFRNLFTPPTLTEFAKEGRGGCRYVDEETLEGDYRFREVVRTSLESSLLYLLLYHTAQHTYVGPDAGLRTIVDLGSAKPPGVITREQHHWANAWALAKAANLDFDEQAAAPILVFLASMSGELPTAVPAFGTPAFQSGLRQSLTAGVVYEEPKEEEVSEAAPELDLAQLRLSGATPAVSRTVLGSGPLPSIAVRGAEGTLLIQSAMMAACLLALALVLHSRNRNKQLREYYERNYLGDSALAPAMVPEAEEAETSPVPERS